MNFPVIPEMYGGKPLCTVHDKVQMVGFTDRWNKEYLQDVQNAKENT